MPRLTGIVLVAALVAAAPGGVMQPWRSLAQPTPGAQPSGVAPQRDLTDRSDPEALYLEGLKRSRASQLPAAIEFWEMALQGYRLRGDRAGEALTLSELGFAQYWLENYDKALPLYAQALAIEKARGRRQREGQLLSQMGDVYFYQKNYTLARKVYEASLPLLQGRKGDGQRLWMTHFRLGDIHFAEKQDDLALKDYQQALDQARALSDQGLERSTSIAIGLTYLRQAQYGQVIKVLQSALSLKQPGEKYTGQEDLLQMIGFSHYWLNDYAQAIDAYEQGLILARSHANARTELLLLNGLGDTYYFLGNPERSRTYFGQSLVMARQLGDRGAEAVALVNLGGAAYQLNDLATMELRYREGLALARRQGQANLEANALTGLGRAYEARGNLARAQTSYLEGLAIYRRIGNSYNAATMHRALAGIALLQKNHALAIAQYRESLALAEASQELYGEAQSLTGLGIALHESGKHAEAEVALRRAIDRNEAIRHKLGQKDELKVALFDTQSSPYIALQAALVAQGKPEPALEVAERARARAFAEQLQSRRTATSPQAAQPLNLADIRRVARDQQATLVEYAVVGQRLYIWTVSPQGTITFRRTPLPDGGLGLDQRVVASRSALGVRGARGSLGVVASTASTSQPQRQQRQDQTLRNLHRLLIEPIADLLPRDPEVPVIVIPQGTLFFVPFAALQDHQGRPLIERHALLTAPAIQVLDLLQGQVSARSRGLRTSNALVAGNPTMPSVRLVPGDPAQPLPPLPGAEQEARAIASLFHTQALIGPAASETEVVRQLPQARFVHLATHGLLDDGATWGLPGAIALAPSVRDDGLLTAEEILGLRLKAELVVLSACDTGRGRITGDGVIGLSRSLLTAGARNVVVSLWAVPDAPTTALMTEFYRELATGAGKAQALRRAILSLRQQDPDPVSWSAFQLVGPAR
jgi:CHAT domain-containing protein